jgi:hypothetical protein
MQNFKLKTFKGKTKKTYHFFKEPKTRGVYKGVTKGQKEKELLLNKTMCEKKKKGNDTSLTRLLSPYQPTNHSILFLNALPPLALLLSSYNAMQNQRKE